MLLRALHTRAASQTLDAVGADPVATAPTDRASPVVGLGTAAAAPVKSDPFTEEAAAEAKVRGFV